MDVVSLGRSARKTANVKVRQPLGEVWVRGATPADAEGIRRFEDEIREELNIKDIRYLDASSDFVDYICKPNLRAVGKKFGKLVPALTEALRTMSAEEARAAAHAVEANQPVQITINGDSYELLPEELLIETSSPEGYTVAESNGMLVALNTTLTDELRIEGTARELVRNIQDARKRAGLEISDRILVYLDEQGQGTLHEVLATWQAYIQSETLATSIYPQEVPADAHGETIELETSTIHMGIVREE
jgi:isoleucyl-tRNA synthetase